MRALHSRWFHHPSITHPTGPLRPDDATIGLILTVLGGTMILGVLAGLMALDSSTGLLVAILVDDSASLGVAILMGAVLFGLAAFTTVWWPMLRRSQRIVAWALAITMWMAGMLLMDLRLETLRATTAEWLVKHPLPAIPGLVIVVGITILAMAYLLRSPRLPVEGAAPESVSSSATRSAGPGDRHGPAALQVARHSAAQHHASRNRPTRTGHSSRP